jgi:hypothetical protein
MRNRDAFVQGLREHGYEDGKNVDIVYRWADGDISRVPELVTDLVAMDPAVIVSAANTGAIALRQAQRLSRSLARFWSIRSRLGSLRVTIARDATSRTLANDRQSAR